MKILKNIENIEVLDEFDNMGIQMGMLKVNNCCSEFKYLNDEIIIDDGEYKIKNPELVNIILNKVNKFKKLNELFISELNNNNIEIYKNMITKNITIKINNKKYTSEFDNNDVIMHIRDSKNNYVAWIDIESDMDCPEAKYYKIAKHFK